MNAGYTPTRLVEKAFRNFQINAAGKCKESTTFFSIFPTCTKMGALEQGMDISESIKEVEFCQNVLVAYSPADMYTIGGSKHKVNFSFTGQLYEEKMTQGEQFEPICRICLESNPISVLDDAGLLAEERLISPCACSGTQAYVHLKCLRKWQNAVLTSTRPGASRTAAIICPVCTASFSVVPLQTGLTSRMLKAISNYSCELAGVICVMCACYFALAGLNLQTILDDFDSALALAREIIPCSFNINMEEGCLSRTCSMLESRLGSGRPSLYPGTILVATAAMPSPFFFGSVVLLYEHRRCSGSRGLILNMPLEEERIFDWEAKSLRSMRNGALSKHVAHGVGGPVAPNDWMVLHKCAGCITSTPKHSCSQSLGKEKPFTRNLGLELLPGVFLGRDISPVLHFAKEETSVTTHQILHGHAEWFVGQLGSEVKRGFWLTEPNASDILLATPPHELWHALINK
ncbi:hypothetical protein KI387_017759 [Taxus chinensis]|uniref:RING-CH-type domain-containing protein n=1 Tax=Taxus chinensis TaxID=29808 RepID=A0AA38LHT8_TAXCH|nr:hypothetical protein KI387_017759 [Taxus chinensis]